ncbi:MAG TPA: M23 family metallopeptidase [Candidatus Lachnoclostridium stercorigallinarum]|uniref:M23 family metallopeptidase n=1 Tax=Candidatus Lachnoclostridium stercorigallinarum TaxID=2838634 RepID=A0A9D2GHT0_9FIRM|nr:M23 family metallopeptidase [Candidatus Lachnoclostridium stercorigallinarum]
MKNKVRQMFKDKLFLVMLVLGLLTIVAAAGVVTIQRGGTEENPYLSMEDQESLIADETEGGAGQLAGASDMEKPDGLENGDSASGSGGEEDRVSGTDVSSWLADSASDTDSAEEAAVDSQSEAALAGAGNDAASAMVLNFTDADTLGWPVRGSVLIDYSMDTTTYFATLEQYKCSPGIVVQSEVSTPVYAPAAARVLEVGSNEELGNYVTLDLGNEYTAICGQLKEIPVAANDYVEAGSLLGYVAEPTKYYSVEGSNVYLELTHEGTPVDPLDYLE